MWLSCFCFIPTLTISFLSPFSFHLSTSPSPFTRFLLIFSSYFTHLFYSLICSFQLLPLNVNLYISFPLLEHFLVCGLLFFLPFSFFSYFYWPWLHLKFLSFSFHVLFILLFYSIPFILLSFFLFLPFPPIITFSVPFSYHPISFFLSIFLLSSPCFPFSYFSFPPFKTY